jgi:hypothetical protein
MDGRPQSTIAGHLSPRDHSSSLAQYFSIEVDVPREQLFDPVGRVIGDMLQNVPKVGFWVQALRLGRFQQRVDRDAEA